MGAQPVEVVESGPRNPLGAGSDLIVEAELLIRRRRTVDGGTSYMSPRVLDLLGRAEGEAARDGGVPVSVLHLMLACAQETTGAVRDVFQAVGVSAPVLRAGLTASKTAPAAAASGGAAGAGAAAAGPAAAAVVGAQVVKAAATTGPKVGAAVGGAAAGHAETSTPPIPVAPRKG